MNRSRQTLPRNNRGLTVAGTNTTLEFTDLDRLSDRSARPDIGKMLSGVDAAGLPIIAERRESIRAGDEKKAGARASGPIPVKQSGGSLGGLISPLEDAKQVGAEQRRQPGDEDARKSGAKVPAPIPQPDVHTRETAFSTFALNVSDVSFKLAAASLEKGALPDAAGLRSEEFLNAFDYRDPLPPPGVPVAFAWERARYPFAHTRDAVGNAVHEHR